MLTVVTLDNTVHERKIKTIPQPTKQKEPLFTFWLKNGLTLDIIAL